MCNIAFDAAAARRQVACCYLRAERQFVGYGGLVNFAAHFHRNRVAGFGRAADRAANGNGRHKYALYRMAAV